MNPLGTSVSAGPQMPPVNGAWFVEYRWFNGNVPIAGLTVSTGKFWEKATTGALVEWTTWKDFLVESFSVDGSTLNEENMLRAIANVLGVPAFGVDGNGTLHALPAQTVPTAASQPVPAPGAVTAGAEPEKPKRGRKKTENVVDNPFPTGTPAAASEAAPLPPSAPATIAHHTPQPGYRGAVDEPLSTLIAIHGFQGVTAGIGRVADAARKQFEALGMRAYAQEWDAVCACLAGALNMLDADTGLPAPVAQPALPIQPAQTA